MRWPFTGHGDSGAGYDEMPKRRTAPRFVSLAPKDPGPSAHNLEGLSVSAVCNQIILADDVIFVHYPEAHNSIRLLVAAKHGGIAYS